MQVVQGKEFLTIDYGSLLEIILESFTILSQNEDCLQDKKHFLSRLSAVLVGVGFVIRPIKNVDIKSCKIH